MKRITTILIPLLLGCILTLGTKKIISALQKPSLDELNKFFPDSPKFEKAERMHFEDLWIVGTVDEYGNTSIGVLKGTSPGLPVVNYSENSDGKVYVRIFDPNGTHVFMDENHDGAIDTTTFVHDGTYYFYGSTNGYPASVKTEDKMWILVDGQYYETERQDDRFYIVRDGEQLEVDRSESGRGIFRIKQ